MFKSALPGMDDIMRQNPDLMQHFTNAAMQSMQQQSPGMSNFMNEFVPQRPPPPAPTRPDVNRVVDVTNESSGSYQPLNVPKPQEARREMSGPTNVENLLSGLKKKKSAKSPSISEIDDLASQVPKPKKKKDKTSISLEL